MYSYELTCNVQKKKLNSGIPIFTILALNNSEYRVALIHSNILRYFNFLSWQNKFSATKLEGYAYGLHK